MQPEEEQRKWKCDWHLCVALSLRGRRLSARNLGSASSVEACHPRAELLYPRLGGLLHLEWGLFDLEWGLFDLVVGMLGVPLCHQVLGALTEVLGVDEGAAECAGGVQRPQDAGIHFDMYSEIPLQVKARFILHRPSPYGPAFEQHADQRLDLAFLHVLDNAWREGGVMGDLPHVLFRCGNPGELDARAVCPDGLYTRSHNVSLPFSTGWNVICERLRPLVFL